MAVNGNLVKEPLLDLTVTTFYTRCTLGIGLGKKDTLPNQLLQYLQLQ